METVLEWIKNYFIFILVLLVFSYLTPKESYKKYIQFFVGIFIAVMLIRPVISWMDHKNVEIVYENLTEVSRRLEQIDYQEKEENIFDIFFVEENTY